MRKAVCLLLACISAGTILLSQTDTLNIPPKREFRGVWFATVTNIDFPSQPGLAADQFKEEWTSKLDFFKEANFNAVFAQVRPTGDAFYNSKIVPWSKYLTGRQGVEPEEKFDPLAFMIEEAHKRGMEFHAWLNPYRASMDTVTMNLAVSHPFSQHPDWFLPYGGKLYFNPAVPEVRNYITEVVLEILMEYQVDGIHFDDYFYPYPAGGELFPDSENFTTYGFGFSSLEAWRRNNVDKLISQVSEMIKTVAPSVKFGISPFGVWRNLERDPQYGSATRAGINSYDDLFADVRGWLEKGWIDYVAPQIYWHIGFTVADYEVLLNWWEKNAFGRQVYIGHAAYKVNNNPEAAWKSPGEIPRQIRLNRSTPAISGSIFYNASSMLRNPLGLVDSLLDTYYVEPALLPEMTFMKLPQPLAPQLDKPKLKDGVLRFTCKLQEEQDMQNVEYIVVYKFEDRKPGDYNNPQNILAILRPDRQRSIVIEDKNIETGKIYTYSASAVNPQHTESNLSNWRSVEVGKKKLKRVK